MSLRLSRFMERLKWRLGQSFPHSPAAEFGAKIERGALFEGYTKKILISQGARIRGDAWLACLDPEASIEVGTGTCVNRWAKIIAAESGGFVRIGEHCSIHSFDVLYGFAGGLLIGNHVRIAANVMFLSSNYLFDDTSSPVGYQGSTSRGIRVGSNVWIGAGSIVLDGVHIGDHSIIGAGSIVAKDTASDSVTRGDPARFSRFRGSRLTDPNK